MFTQGHLRALGLVAVLLLGITGGSAVALDVQDIKIITATERQDGVLFDHFFEVKIEGTGISNVAFQNTTTLAWYVPTYDAGYAQLADLYTVHPNDTGYYFYFNVDEGPTWEDVVLLGYARYHPTDYVHFVYPRHLQAGVPLEFDVQFDFNGWAEMRGMKLIDDTEGVVEDEVFTGLDVDTWALGPLDHGHQYSIEAGAWSVVGGSPFVSWTLNGDTFAYTGVIVDSNRVSFVTTTREFSTTTPEPATMMLLGGGLVAGAWLRRRRAK